MYGRSAAKRLIRSPEAGFLLFHTALNFVFKKVARAHCAHKQIYTDAPITVRSKRSALLYRSFAYFRLARPRLQFGCQGGLSHSRCREGGLKSAVVSSKSAVVSQRSAVMSTRRRSPDGNSDVDVHHRSDGGGLHATLLSRRGNFRPSARLSAALKCAGRCQSLHAAARHAVIGDAAARGHGAAHRWHGAPAACERRRR